jgi:hypothetical protein
LARAERARTPTPDQLTLDDWSEMLSARQAAERRRSPEKRVHAAAPLEAPGKDHLAGPCSESAVEAAPRHDPVATDLLETPGALLTRTHLRELGLERRAIDAVFRRLPVVSLPGYSRPMIHVEQYLELIRENTYRDDRVRPSHA